MASLSIDRRMRSVALSVTLLGGWLLMSASHGEIYAWRDAAGHLQFGDKKPTGTAAAPLHVRRVNSIQAVTVEASLNAGGTQTVTMYSASWCGYCRQARDYFNRQSIPFEEYAIEISAQGRDGYARLQGQGVPIILFGKQRMNGFDQQQFAALYH